MPSLRARTSKPRDRPPGHTPERPCCEPAPRSRRSERRQLVSAPHPASRDAHTASPCPRPAARMPEPRPAHRAAGRTPRPRSRAPCRKSERPDRVHVPSSRKSERSHRGPVPPSRKSNAHTAASTPCRRSDAHTAFPCPLPQVGAPTPRSRAPISRPDAGRQSRNAHTAVQALHPAARTPAPRSERRPADPGREPAPGCPRTPSSIPLLPPRAPTARAPPPAPGSPRRQRPSRSPRR